MSHILHEYNERLAERNIHSYDAAILHGIEQRNPKFGSTGDVKSFYGSTCIAWIDRESELFQRLSLLQVTLQQTFQQAGLGNMLAFLVPESFHMTICDIDANSDASCIPFHDRIRQIQRACRQIGTPGSVSCELRGLGLKTTITVLVEFSTEDELKKVLATEHTIKEATNTNIRHFTGHITLAYFVRYPGEHLHSIKDILLPYHDADIGEFIFSQFDFTVFTDMNRFTPILTINLINGTTTAHEDNIGVFTPILG